MSEKKSIVEVKKWTTVAMWSWNVEVENCAICKNQISDLCIECTANSNASGDCQVAWGACNHAYHHHCISRWLKTRAACPLCDNDWEMRTVTKNQ